MPEPVSQTRSPADLYLAVAIGGAIGAVARHAIGVLFPTATDGWPTGTFLVNLSGALILGVVIAVAGAVAPDPAVSDFARRLRPFLITGVLGGYTTFSTYLVETHGLVVSDQTPMAMLYLLGSMLAGIFLVAVSMAVTTSVIERVRPSIDETSTAAVDERDLTEDEG